MAEAQNSPVAQISEIRAKNIRAFKNLFLRLSPRPNEGQWIILLGDNGTGKTTLLRSIALTILASDVAQTLLLTSKFPVFYVRQDAEYGEFNLKINGEMFTAKFRPKGRKNTHSHVFNDANERSVPFFVGYGSKRGSALGDGRAPSSERPQDPVLTLFDEQAELIQAESWLEKLDYETIKTESEDARATLDSAINALTSLLPEVSEIRVNPNEVMVKVPAGLIPLSSLSDGYLTTLGWVVDLLARWQENSGNAKPLAPASMTGIVLLDEIDLHLHPKWQCQIIPMLRSVFPLMTFVVTTHSPLTVLGAKPGELHVLERSDDGQEVTISQRDIRPGATADEILTSVLFDLASTTDQETLDLLQRHAEMARSKSAVDASEMKNIEAELTNRLTSPIAQASEALFREKVQSILYAEDKVLTEDEQASAIAKIRNLMPEKEEK